MYEYYYGTEAEQFNFIKIPRAFFTDKERFGTLSNEAKIMYSLLLDRMNLSMKNGWLDEHNRVYIIYTIDEIAETMGCGTNLAVRILKELDDENGIGLIHKKRRGFGLPMLIYVKNFFVGESSEKRKAEKSSECSKSEFKSCENENSNVCKNNTQECSKGECNYTYPNKTDMSYTDNQSFTPVCEQDFGMNEMIDRAEIEETVKKLIGFTPEEWEVICKKAKVARLRTGTYIRRMAVNGEIRYYELKELVALKRAFLSTGNNLNQIAKVQMSQGRLRRRILRICRRNLNTFGLLFRIICLIFRRHLFRNVKIKI